MLQRVSDAIATTCGCELVGLVRVDREPSRFVCEALTSTLPTAAFVGYGRELGSGVVGKVAANGVSIVLDDVRDDPDYIETLPGARSELCVPILRRGEVLAVLNLESPRLAAFRGQLPLFEAVAERISGAIASALLFEGAGRRAANLDLLAELSRRAFAVEDLDLRLQEMAAFVRERLGLSLVALLVADQRGRVWRHRAIATAKLTSTPERGAWPVDAGIVGRAVRTGTPQLVLDTASDESYLAVAADTHCEYVVPLKLRSKRVAALNVEAADRAQLGSENLELFRTLAEHSVGAIELGLVHRQLRLANRRLARLSGEDALTGLANRRRFDRALEIEWHRGERSRAPLAVALLDLDQFKAFNDAEGHPAGDRCLRTVARLLRSRIQRATDLVGRYGGEEFVLLLPGLDVQRAAQLVESLLEELRRLALPHPASPTGFVTLSGGVAACTPTPAVSPKRLIEAADRALYDAKRAGRDRVAVDSTNRGRSLEPDRGGK